MTIVGGVGTGEATVGRAAVDVGVTSGRVVVVVVVPAVVEAAAAATSGVGVIDSPSATAANAGAPSPGGIAMIGAVRSSALCACSPLAVVCCVLCGGKGGKKAS